MKRNDFLEIKALDIPTLRDKIKKLKEEIAEMTMDKNMNKLKDLKSIGKVKKDVAQVATVLRQKELLVLLEGKESPEVKEMDKKEKTK